MNKIFKNLMVAGILSIASLSAFALSIIPLPASTTPVISEDEGLFCTVWNDQGTVIASCTLCNCAKLAESAR